MTLYYPQPSGSGQVGAPGSGQIGNNTMASAAMPPDATSPASGAPRGTSQVNNASGTPGQSTLQSVSDSTGAQMRPTADPTRDVTNANRMDQQPATRAGQTRLMAAMEAYTQNSAAQQQPANQQYPGPTPQAAGSTGATTGTTTGTASTMAASSGTTYDPSAATPAASYNQRNNQSVNVNEQVRQNVSMLMEYGRNNGSSDVSNSPGLNLSSASFSATA
ncbi:hypothetical protein [Thiorhodovibrio winogradskyi]|nr:hypothetical protein [Thiorhodovibrio winogradskyi]